MRFIRKILEAIPLEKFPKLSGLPKGTGLVMTATIAQYCDEKLLVATFYHRKTKKPYCRIFHTKTAHITMLYYRGEWSNKKIDNIGTPSNKWANITASQYTAIADDVSKAIGARFFGYKDVDTLKAIERWQKELSTAELAARNAADDTITERVSELMPPLPADLEQQVLEGPLFYSRYLFYRRGANKQYFGYCTHCKSEHELDFIPKHKAEGTCPSCGSPVSVRARGISRDSLGDSCNYMVWITQGRAVFARLFNVHRGYGGAPEDVVTEFKELERFYFTDAGLEQDKKDLRLAYKFKRVYDWKKGTMAWYKAQTITENYYDYNLYPHPKDIFVGTCAEHSHLDDYIENCYANNEGSKPMQYLAQYIEHPSIEHLMACGLFYLVQDIVTNKSLGNLRFDWNKSRPREILGVTQPELDKIIELKLCAGKIAIYKRLKPLGITLSDDDLDIIDVYYCNKERAKVMQAVGEKRAIKYLKYQKRRYYSGSSYDFIYRQWQDYREAALKLNYDMENDYYCFPPKLLKAHDHAAELVRELMVLEDKQKYAAQQKQWEKQCKALKALCYTDGELMIRPCAGTEELITEGAVLKHCVAQYADRACKGETYILFIRKVTAPEEPYYTMNITPKGKLIQCHGYRNKLDTHEQGIKDFEEEWFKNAVAPWLKKRGQRPPVSRGKAQQNIRL